MRQKLSNFGFTRKSGILMPVSALPGKYGIGSFGVQSFKFIDFLVECGQRCWQVLPLNPTAYGDSPYQSPCSFAGNPYFIDIDLLVRDGLLAKDEAKAEETDAKRIDYGKLFETRIRLLKKAYARFKVNSDFIRFKQKNADWLDDYSLFMSLKEANGYKQWTEWGDCKFYDYAKLKRAEYAGECEFWKFVQYEFFSQYKAVKKYAKSKGISIIGDMPIYVAYDSVEVWSNPLSFLLDDNLSPKVVAGCPPDAFSDDGQLWGNPIYDWKKMEQEGFSWWKKRAERTFKLYDIIRIDHFRGFAGYYVIPAKDTTAKNGKWEEGVGYPLFEAISDAVPKAKIIAEDLGHITDDVRELLKKTGYPGMKVLQFAFTDSTNEYLPKNYKSENCVVYTGTHDSMPTKAWYESLDDKTKKVFERECPCRFSQTPTNALVSLALGSNANLAIIPLQDYMELGEESRINMPSTAQGNWTWRVSSRYATSALKTKILQLTAKANRL